MNVEIKIEPHREEHLIIIRENNTGSTSSYGGTVEQCLDWAKQWLGVA